MSHTEGIPGLQQVCVVPEHSAKVRSTALLFPLLQRPSGKDVLSALVERSNCLDESRADAREHRRHPYCECRRPSFTSFASGPM